MDDSGVSRDELQAAEWQRYQTYDLAIATALTLLYMGNDATAEQRDEARELIHGLHGQEIPWPVGSSLDTSITPVRGYAIVDAGRPFHEWPVTLYDKTIEH
jgi:hypothetical protein